ncbi:MAG TPA: uracil-DNA glycosylase family protein [Gemmatimonadaceae bacterium]|nr:uracil-DNA glycosylase family protein [Gemmatimonadaceae bacterium]
MSGAPRKGKGAAPRAAPRTAKQTARRSSRALSQFLDEHRERLAACRQCALAPGVLPIISQARAPRVMLIGQAPGKVEIADRRPFAGRAGRTLFRWLERAGLSEAEARERIYIAAITRCYPGPSPSGRGDRVPSPAERAACAPWLERELEIIRPALLILIGRLAIDRFLGPVPLASVVGELRSVSHAGGESRVVALPHPSGASAWLNDPAHKALVERALDTLRVELSTVDVVRAGTHGARRSA